MKTTSNIAKGSQVFLSQKGARGFIYPSEVIKTVLFDTKLERINLLGGGDKKSFWILESAVNEEAQIPERKIVIWL